MATGKFFFRNVSFNKKSEKTNYNIEPDKTPVEKIQFYFPHNYSTFTKIFAEGKSDWNGEGGGGS